MSAEENDKHRKIVDLRNVHYFNNNNLPARDHDHLTGKYRGIVCNHCNLQMVKPGYVPIFSHNLSGYDSHFIITQLGVDSKTINVIPNTEEKFISFTKYVLNSFQIPFVDTYRFMATSLEKLVNNLGKGDISKFKETRKVFINTNVELVTRKGVYPYEYTDGWSKLDENSLPKKKSFLQYILNESDISDDDYIHAKRVWEKFNCTTLGEDTGRINSSEHAICSRNNIKISDYGPSKSWITYLDATNLYDRAMSQFMPKDGFSSYKGDFKLDDFDSDVVRRTVHEFYDRSEYPTSELILNAVKSKINYSGSLSTIQRLLRNLKFSCKKCSDGRKFLMERNDIVALRYTRSIVYLEETWVNQNHSRSIEWQHDSINNGNSTDYHSQMNSEVFKSWFTQMLNSLEEPSVIVMDNASYHSTLIDNFPKSNT
ncbi:hypothetical protein AGLY_013902 [Aphis glycines]|uniref:DNA-directed DNA polymerase n=1 Tax=Aphis glycines TaxID=307491 RepID=A0A6G0T5E1_APHGL|nr:hypothetical protein AGLY_013902 [Aphis glycines]